MSSRVTRTEFRPRGSNSRGRGSMTCLLGGSAGAGVGDARARSRRDWLCRQGSHQARHHRHGIQRFNERSSTRRLAALPRHEGGSLRPDPRSFEEIGTPIAPITIAIVVAQCARLPGPRSSSPTLSRKKHACRDGAHIRFSRLRDASPLSVRQVIEQIGRAHV